VDPGNFRKCPFVTGLSGVQFILSQVTGCIDSTKFHLEPSDTGGQFDVRFPNGAQCTFGGQGASFIELCVVPQLFIISR
jgi:hypothetical protein